MTNDTETIGDYAESIVAACRSFEQRVEQIAFRAVEEAASEDLLDALGSLALALRGAEIAAQHWIGVPDPIGAVPQAIIDAGNATRAAFVEPVDPRALTAELQRLARAFDELTLATDAHTPCAAEVYVAGTLDVDKIADDVRKMLGEQDDRVGPAGGGAPLVVKRGPDGFDGDTTISVEYAPWASQPVKARVRTLWTREWLPSLKALHGEGAVGARRDRVLVDDTRVCRVLFGTNRAADVALEGGFGSGRAELSLGEALVSVPTARREGTAPRPWRILGLGPREDPRKHVVLVDNPKVLTEREFVALVGPRDRSAFLFVHGFNTSFAAGLWRTAQIAVDLDIEGPVFHFSWPSAGKWWKYDYDSDSVNASEARFERFVTTILDRCNIDRLNVLAHSKGNQLVLNVFRTIAKARGSPGCDNLVLASPDVDVDVVEDRMQAVPGFVRNVTLYASKHDRPLTVSGGKAMRIRAGGIMSDGYPLILRSMDSIDAADSDFGYFGLNHSAYMDVPVLRYDLKALFARGVRPPDLRSPSIVAGACDRGTYYRMVTR